MTELGCPYILSMDFLNVLGTTADFVGNAPIFENFSETIPVKTSLLKSSLTAEQKTELMKMYLIEIFVRMPSKVVLIDTKGRNKKF